MQIFVLFVGGVLPRRERKDNTKGERIFKYCKKKLCCETGGKRRNTRPDFVLIDAGVAGG